MRSFIHHLPVLAAHNDIGFADTAQRCEEADITEPGVRNIMLLIPCHCPSEDMQKSFLTGQIQPSSVFRRLKAYQPHNARIAFFRQVV